MAARPETRDARGRGPSPSVAAGAIPYVGPLSRPLTYRPTYLPTYLPTYRLVYGNLLPDAQARTRAPFAELESMRALLGRPCGGAIANRRVYREAISNPSRLQRVFGLRAEIPGAVGIGPRNDF